MNYSKIFTEAKEQVASGKTRYICLAVEDIMEDYQEGKALCEMIESSLRPRYSIEGYMECFDRDRYISMTLEDFKDFRLTWLDSLIAYCKQKEAEGDVIKSLPSPEL